VILKMSVLVNKLQTFTGHRDCVYTLQPSELATNFFSGAGDGMVVQWNVDNPDQGELVAKLPNSVYALHYHPQTKLLIAGHNYEGIHLLDWKNKQEAGSLQLTKAAIFDIQSLGSKVFVATGEGSVLGVDIGQLVVVNQVSQSAKSARTLAINVAKGELAVGYSDAFIRIFDIDTLTLKQEWRAHTNSVFTVRYSPDGNYLFSGSRDARFKVWDARAGYGRVTEVVAHMYAINHIEFSPDGKHFVTCSMDKSIKVWALGELKLLKVIDRARHAGHGTSVNKLLWMPYRSQLLSASDDRSVSAWDINFAIQD
jgi:WD40 repeat protein